MLLPISFLSCRARVSTFGRRFSSSAAAAEIQDVGEVLECYYVTKARARLLCLGAAGFFSSLRSRSGALLKTNALQPTTSLQKLQ